MTAAMPMGSRHRVTGLLLNSKRGLILEMDTGVIYALDADPTAVKFLGHRVTIEGIRNGFDRLDVEWIGRAAVEHGITLPSA